jgi:hypothetical protein
MSTQEEAREAMVQHRQQEEHLQQSMLSRLAAEINTPVEPENQQDTRVMAHCQQEEHLQQSTLSCSVAEVGIPVEADSSSQEQP